MAGKPMLLRDLERLRPHLQIEPFDRVRVILGASDRNLCVDLECVVCEELLVWDLTKGWWVCPGCGQETTDKEGVDLLSACYEGLRELIEHSSDEQREGVGVGRWLREVTKISKR